MGADGGIMWLRLRGDHTRTDLQDHVWFLWQMTNDQAYAYEGEFSSYDDVTAPAGNWLEGGYGTDCTFDLTWLSEFVGYCTDEEANHPPSGDPRDLTFRELEESLLTDPEFNLWKWSSYKLPYYGNFWDAWWKKRQWAPITESVVRKLKAEIPRETDGYLATPWPSQYVPERFLDMTVREWGRQLERIIIPYTEIHEETWT